MRNSDDTMRRAQRSLVNLRRHREDLLLGQGPRLRLASKVEEEVDVAAIRSSEMSWRRIDNLKADGNLPHSPDQPGSCTTPIIWRSQNHHAGERTRACRPALPLAMGEHLLGRQEDLTGVDEVVLDLHDAAARIFESYCSIIWTDKPVSI